jgi:hypothetical protein
LLISLATPHQFSEAKHTKAMKVAIVLSILSTTLLVEGAPSLKGLSQSCSFDRECETNVCCGGSGIYVCTVCCPAYNDCPFGQMCAPNPWTSTTFIMNWILFFPSYTFEKITN